MSWSLLVSTKAGLGTNGGTTSAIDTSGANLLFVAAGCQGGPSISDSNGNTWNAVSTGVTLPKLWWSVPSTVGSGHTFSVTGTSTYPGVAVMAFSGADPSPYDQSSGAGGSSSSTRQPGSITPSLDGCLLLTAAHNGTGGWHASLSIDSGFTIDQKLNFSGGNNYGVATAYLAQTSAAAVNPTWNFVSSPYNYAVMVVFKPGTSSIVPLLWHKKHLILAT